MGGRSRARRGIDVSTAVLEGARGGHPPASRTPCAFKYGVWWRGGLLSIMAEPEPEQMAHKFWDTQPVPRLDEGPIDESNEAVEPDKPQ
eukprot:COSAG01_NODE_47134_length_393_cov_0.942177_1_plen_88_part_10